MTAKHMPERHASDILLQTFINRIFAIAFQSEHKKIQSVTTIPKHKPLYPSKSPSSSLPNF